MTVLLLQCAKWAVSHLSMIQAMSPNNHSPVKLSPGIHTTDSESDIGEIENYNCDQLEGCGEGKFYNLKYREMDGTYDHNILFSLTLTNGVVPASVCNNHVYNGCRPAIWDNTLNKFKGPLDIDT